ncbi:hypothetical protein FRC17_001065 [Serendipita sp. 399]|nr:hypothetical protein FRC17_001065 [Serendipita sp. 399]
MASTIPRRVAAAMERIAPLRLAEKWDNVSAPEFDHTLDLKIRRPQVGLLIESPVARPNAKQVLLTIDHSGANTKIQSSLTTAVCEEAISRPISAIVAYHPPLFKPLSSLRLDNPLQASLLRCAASGISIFSPHTSLDVMKRGVNDWLIKAFYNVESVAPLEPKNEEEVGTGIGRLVLLKQPLLLEDLLPLIKRHLGIQYLQVARSSIIYVKSIAICAGSGGSVLKDVQADLLLTGEMSHHEVLAAVAKGANVVLCGHSNTERGYLAELRGILEDELKKDGDDALEVHQSTQDRDPLDVVDRVVKSPTFSLKLGHNGPGPAQMTDYNSVDPQDGWEYDLHSIYSAYISVFQSIGILWWREPWGKTFTSFDVFLNFGWPAIAITSVDPPYQAHIITKAKSLQDFVDDIEQMFHFELPVVTPNIAKIKPFEKRACPMRYIHDLPSYKRIFETLPAVGLAAMKERTRSGDVNMIKRLWASKTKTFLSVDFEWSEENPSVCLEFGYAAVRTNFLSRRGMWPPTPELNYRYWIHYVIICSYLKIHRKGHYVIEEHTSIVNRHAPTYPKKYQFGQTEYISKQELRMVFQTIMDSLATPDFETPSNELLLIAHGISGDLKRLTDLQIHLPNNIILLDTAAYERSLHRIGESPVKNPRRKPGSSVALSTLLTSLDIDTSETVFHNSGNDAYLTLVALQLMLEPTTQFKKLKRLSEATASSEEIMSHFATDLRLDDDVPTVSTRGYRRGRGRRPYRQRHQRY